MGSTDLVLCLSSGFEDASPRSASDDEGATLVEYALIVAMIAVVAIVAIQLIGSNVSAAIADAASSI